MQVKAGNINKTCHWMKRKNGQEQSFRSRREDGMRERNWENIAADIKILLWA